jgi:hypothetical protein
MMREKGFRKRVGEIETIGEGREHNGEMGAGRWKHRTTC